MEENMVEVLETLENEFHGILDQMNRDGRDPSMETLKLYRAFKKKKEDLEQQLKEFFNANDAHITLYFLDGMNRIGFQFENFQMAIEYQRRKKEQGFVVAMFPTIAIIQDTGRDGGILKIYDFIERLKNELLSCKHHKLRAVVQGKYVQIDSVQVSEVKLDENERDVRSLFIEGKGFGDIQEALNISREEVKNVLARLKTHNLI